MDFFLSPLFFFEFLPRTIMVTSFLAVVLEVVCTIRDTKVTSADEKKKGADLIWSNLANN